jgi:hypothetical protein
VSDEPNNLEVMNFLLSGNPEGARFFVSALGSTENEHAGYAQRFEALSRSDQLALIGALVVLGDPNGLSAAIHISNAIRADVLREVEHRREQAEREDV